MPAPLRHALTPTTTVVGRLLVVAMVYFAAARTSIELPTREGEVAAVWLASGIGLAAVLSWGRSMLGGVLLGELVAAYVGGIGLGASLALACGNVLETLVMAELLRAARFRRTFPRVADVLTFVGAVAAGAAVSSTIAVATFLSTGAIGIDDARMHWVLFASSIALGAVLVAPAIFATQSAVSRSTSTTPDHPRLDLPRGERALEGLMLLLLVLVVSAAAFDRGHLDVFALFLLFPLFVWATLRFGSAGASLSVLVVTTIGVLSVARGATTVDGLSFTATTQLVQAVLAVVAITNLLLTAVLHERDHARRVARRAARTLQQAETVAGVGSWELDPRTFEMRWSPELTSLLDAPTDRAPRRLDDLLAGVDERDRDELVRRLHRTLRTGERFELEHRLARTDERERTVLHAAARSNGVDGAPEVVGAVLDITEQKELEFAKSTMIATASHELRTPLTSIIGFADTLITHWDSLTDSDRAQFVDVIRDQADRMTRLVDKSLVLSQVDAGVMPATPEPIRVSEAVRRALDGLHRDDVLVKVDDELVCSANATQFEQIIDNLVINADKYGDPPIEIVGQPLPAGGVEIRVIDHGNGVSREFEPQLFTRFTRAANVATKQGSGLGLSIVRGLARASGGDVRYERRPNETAFVVTMPSWSADADA